MQRILKGGGYSKYSKKMENSKADIYKSKKAPDYSEAFI
jgi:hypothetical protein